MNAMNEVFKCHNSIIELSRIISEMAWREVNLDIAEKMDPNVIAALADGINAAANAAMDTTQGCLINMRDENRDDETKGEKS
jgi:hypothetical protein